MATNVANAGFDLMVYDLCEEPLKELAGLGAPLPGLALARQLLGRVLGTEG